MIAAILLLCACQPTPEEEVVVNKADQQQMLSDAEKQDGRMEIVDLYERLGAPKEYKASLSGTEGRLQVEVDAKVLLPEGELPIVRVEPRVMSRSDVLAYVDAVFSPDMQFVDSNSGNWQTKGFYAHEIEKAKWAMDHWNDGGSIIYDMDCNSPSDVQEKWLNKYYMQQAEAPETAPRIERSDLDMTWIVATSDDVNFSAMFVAVNPWDNSVERIDYIRSIFDNPNVHWMQNVPNGIREQDAKAAAEAFLEKLPVEGLTLRVAVPEIYSDDYSRQVPCWRFYYTREFSGAEESFTNSEYTSDSEYNHQRAVECLMIVVDEQGVAGFRYNAPQNVLETVSERTSLLPFSKIEEIFNRMILVYNNRLNDGTQDEARWTYHITSIRLGLVNIAEENAETGLLIPAWDFMGYWHSEYKNWIEDISTNEQHSFLTINAIDGSIINRAG
jgi:hypothetical protein